MKKKHEKKQNIVEWKEINYNDLLIKINFNENEKKVWKKWKKNIKLHRILSAVNFDFKTLKLLIN